MRLLLGRSTARWGSGCGAIHVEPATFGIAGEAIHLVPSAIHRASVAGGKDGVHVDPSALGKCGGAIHVGSKLTVEGPAAPERAWPAPVCKLPALSPVDIVTKYDAVDGACGG